MKLINGESLSLGVCYYPEHWNELFWEDDIKRMKNCGIKTMRIGEFAWSKIEYKEEEFDFTFFDHFLEYSGEKWDVCDFWYAPPAWLTEKYEEVLNTTKDGIRYRHGARRHYNYNGPGIPEIVKKNC